jgi:hypothetical protein
MEETTERATAHLDDINTAPPWSGARPKDPETGADCNIVVNGAVWKPPERPKDPETGETCSIVSGGKVLLDGRF